MPAKCAKIHDWLWTWNAHLLKYSISPVAIPVQTPNHTCERSQSSWLWIPWDSSQTRNLTQQIGRWMWWVESMFLERRKEGGSWLSLSRSRCELSPALTSELCTGRSYVTPPCRPRTLPVTSQRRQEGCPGSGCLRMRLPNPDVHRTRAKVILSFLSVVIAFALTRSYWASGSHFSASALQFTGSGVIL